jgi:SWI/SNF-related matrix-associated actin-dependent regulator 1 of chromatin subfamily A
MDEIFKFTDRLPVAILSGQAPIAPRRGAPIVLVINYDILTYWEKALRKAGIKTLVLDEAHYIKNRKAKRSAALMRIGKHVDRVIALSGTPITNRPEEFFNVLKLLDPKLFPSVWEFVQRYCGAKWNGFGWDFKGATNTQELHEILSERVMLRRLKSDVLRELPPKTRVVIPLTLPVASKREYDKADAEFESWLNGKSSTVESKSRVEALKAIAFNGKYNQCVEWIREYLDANGKLVVFAVHHKAIDMLRDTFKKTCVVIDGRTAMKDRAGIVKRFQGDPSIKLLIGNIQAAGTGITLTAASSTCFVELSWSPGEHTQAEDRVHRIGQKANCVTAYYLVAERTIDEEIATLIDQKANMLSKVLDGKEVSRETLLSTLLKNRKLRERV